MEKPREGRDSRACPHCGRGNRAAARFCKSCGTPLTPGAARERSAAIWRRSAPGQRATGGPAGPGREAAAPGSLSLRTSLSRLRGALVSLARAVSARPEEPSETVALSPPLGPLPLAQETVQPAAPASEGTGRTRADLLWGVLSVLCVVAGQWQLDRGQSAPATALYVAGVLLGLWAFRRNRDFAMPAAASREARTQFDAKWLVPLTLIPGGAAAWSLQQLLFDPDRPPKLFWTLHIVSIALLVGLVYFVERRAAGPGGGGRRREGAAGRAAPGPRTDAQPGAAPGEWTNAERLAVLATVCIGLFLRLHELPEFPPGTWYDEATAGLEAQRILDDPEYRPLYVAALMGPEHYVYLVSFLFLLLPKITFVVRFATVITGVLSVPAAFLAGRQLFGRGPALALAFLIAVSRWSINFSRIGMFNILMTLFVLLGAGLLLRALRRGRLTDYLWAGLCLGFGLNTYYAFQIFLAVAALFVLYHLVLQGGSMLSRWKELVVLAMGVLLFLAPLATYAFARLDRYLERTKTVSIFEEYPQEEVWEKVGENAVSHLLMYNVRGDPNGRHNLPGLPMLAPVTGALLVLGLALSLCRTWRPRFFFLNLWFFGLLAGGVFSLSFEAPQSLRAIGTLPVVYILGMVPLSFLWQNWRAAGGAGPGGGEESSQRERWSRVLRRGRPARSAVLGLVSWRGGPALFVAVLAAAAALYNYRAYFVRQMNDFAVWNAYSTGETIAAEIVAKQVDRKDSELFLTSHFFGHPAVRFVGSQEPYFRKVAYTDTLPMPLPPDRDAVFLMDPNRRNFYEQARSFYPQAEFIEHRPPFGGPAVLYEIRLKPEDIASIQGVNAAHYRGETWEGEPAAIERDAELAAEWPRDALLEGPFAVEWTGILNVTQHGPHKLSLRAPAQAELYVNEELVARLEGRSGGAADGQAGVASAALELALGLHDLRVRAAGGRGEVALSWQRPGEEEEVIPTSALYAPPVASSGLLGRYYPNGSWQGPPAFSRIDPQINIHFHDIPLPRPYSVEWVGKLAVQEEGAYHLGIESIDESELWIDGNRVAASVVANQYDESEVKLTAGLHDIRIRYVARTSHYHVNLYWARPGRGRAMIASSALVPPKGSYANVVLEDLGGFDEARAGSGAALAFDEGPLPLERKQAARMEIVGKGFKRPRGVVAANGRLYVVDAGLRALVILDAAGDEQGRVRRSNRRFIEPVDIAADSEGRLYVLDTGAGKVSLHDAEGRFVRVVPISAKIVDRSRGLDVDRHGRIWLALTPALAVAAFDVDGQEVVRIATAFAGREFQPVDVAVGGEDSVYVTTVGESSLIRFSTDGAPQSMWRLARANSVDGPHLSFDGRGTLYVTQPELGEFLTISGRSADEQEMWTLPGGRSGRKLVGIAVGEEGDVFLTDSEQGSVYGVRLSR